MLTRRSFFVLATVAPVAAPAVVDGCVAAVAGGGVVPVVIGGTGASLSRSWISLAEFDAWLTNALNLTFEQAAKGPVYKRFRPS